MRTGFSTRNCRKCLALSLTPEKMNFFAKMVNPNYDLFKNYGFTDGRPIGAPEAAKFIIEDMIKNGHYLDFVEKLLEIDDNGYMGKKQPFIGIDDVFDDVLDSGFEYDETTGLFFEDQDQQITRNWGRLLEGDERQMAILRLDIVGNSLLVKNNPREQIDKAYADLREIVTNAVVSRIGRLWMWEGDGALAAFMLNDYSRMAIFAAIDILNEIFFYNKTKNPLSADVKLRIAVNSGSIFYSSSNAKISKIDVILKAILLESKAAAPNSLVISESLAVSQDQSILDIFSNTMKITDTSEKYRIYHVNMGKD